MSEHRSTAETVALFAEQIQRRIEDGSMAGSSVGWPGTDTDTIAEELVHVMGNLDQAVKKWERHTDSGSEDRARRGLRAATADAAALLMMLADNVAALEPEPDQPAPGVFLVGHLNDLYHSGRTPKGVLRAVRVDIPAPEEQTDFSPEAVRARFDKASGSATVIPDASYDIPVVLSREDIRHISQYLARNPSAAHSRNAARIIADILYNAGVDQEETAALADEAVRLIVESTPESTPVLDPDYVALREIMQSQILDISRLRAEVEQLRQGTSTQQLVRRQAAILVDRWASWIIRAANEKGLSLPGGSGRTAADIEFEHHLILQLLDQTPSE